MSFPYSKKLKELLRVINPINTSFTSKTNYSDLFSVYWAYKEFLRQEMSINRFLNHYFPYLQYSNENSNKFYVKNHIFYRNIIIFDNREALRMLLELIVYGYIIDYTGCYAYYRNVNYEYAKQIKDIRQLDYSLYNFLIENNIPAIFTVPKLTNEFVLYNELAKNMELYYKVDEEEKEEEPQKYIPVEEDLPW